MPQTPEDQARNDIDRLLKLAGWQVCDRDNFNIDGACGVAIRQFQMAKAVGEADYLLYVGGKAAGVIEAKAAGVSLMGTQTQAEKYAAGFPPNLPFWDLPLPFIYQANGAEVLFTEKYAEHPRARHVFAFHRPQYLLAKLQAGKDAYFSRSVKNMPPLPQSNLWKIQIDAISNLEKSFAADRRRAFIQMTMGSGKTYTAINAVYRLIKYANARVLFLVDRANLGMQAEQEFADFTPPGSRLKFNQEFIIQRMTESALDGEARVCIATIQRLYAMLSGQGQALDEENEEISSMHAPVVGKPQRVEYNPDIPIGKFDLIVVDECHRSIYLEWMNVLDYFDARIVGLTATPGKATFAFFENNLVIEYPHEQAVADGINVPFDVFRIRTEVTEGGGKIEEGAPVQIQDRTTRAKRWEKMSEDFEYPPEMLDRQVTTPHQIKTILTVFKDKWQEIFPDRENLPKTIIFAKDDNHAEIITGIVREVFDEGNDFAQKITYRSGDKPQDLIKTFRNSFMPRIAVTVDMVATGTDIKPVEIVFFMRAVKSRAYFEQMKGRGVRVIDGDTLQSVSGADAKEKDRFVIIDAVGVCDMEKMESRPMERKREIGFNKLMEMVALGSTDADVLISLAGRLARLNRKLPEEEKAEITAATGGLNLADLAKSLVDATDERKQYQQAQHCLAEKGETREPTEDEITAVADKFIKEAVRPLRRPEVRNAVIAVKEKNEMIIDRTTVDTVKEAQFDYKVQESAKKKTESFRAFIEKHKDEITALQIIYTKPRKNQITHEDIKQLAERINTAGMTESNLWAAYAKLDKAKVRGVGKERLLTDLVALVRYALQQTDILYPFADKVNENFEHWLKEQAGREFNDEQMRWLENIRDHIAANLCIVRDDFGLAPFEQAGGLGRVYELFGDELDGVLNDLNERLVA